MCGNSGSHVVGRIKLDKLYDAYMASYGVTVNHLFSSDGYFMQLNDCVVCGLKWYSPLAAGDDHFYEGLQKHDWYYQDYKPEYDFAKGYISDDDHVLEVGCGKGAFHQFLPKNIRYRGLEFNKAAIEKARSIGLDAEATPIEKEAIERPCFYDVVCHFQVLEHVTSPRDFLENCVKALKPGGKLIVAVPSEDSFLSIVENGWLNMPPHHLTRWSDQALKSAFSSVGLVTKEIWHEPVADFHADWYRNVMVNFGIKQVVGADIGLESDWLWSKVSRRLNNVSFVKNLLLRVGEKGFAYSGRGHTVCAIAMKKV